MIEKKNASGAVSGHWAVSPSGNVVLLPVGAKLKDGFKYATAADLATAEKAAAAAAAKDAVTGGPVKAAAAK